MGDYTDEFNTIKESINGSLVEGAQKVFIHKQPNKHGEHYVVVKTTRDDGSTTETGQLMTRQEISDQRRQWEQQGELFMVDRHSDYH